jgi:cation diffusion facilitator family transporter
MHSDKLDQWRHSHDFTAVHESGERRTSLVLALTAITMVVEIMAGQLWGSMALLADGWHMGTHVAAFAISLFAYRYARRHAGSHRFSFGTGKVSVLGGFASAVALAVVALIMALESVSRLVKPHAIQFDGAILVAVAGLVVNLVCALLLGGHHHHEDGHHHHDHNLRAAYLHVLADAFTSVLAIVALLAGKYAGLTWLDPVMGIVGALVISHWSLGLLRQTSTILLDAEIDNRREKRIRSALEADSGDRVSDLHIWKVGPVDYAVIAALVTHEPGAPDDYKARLEGFTELSHITVEVNRCPGTG